MRRFDRAVRQNFPVRVASAVILTVAFTVTAFGQETSSPKAKLGFSAGAAGNTVRIPLTLEGAQSTHIAKVVSRVAFPHQLSFIRLEPGTSRGKGEVVELEWTVHDSELQEGKDPSSPEKGEVVEIQITSSDGAGPLPDGVLAYLAFRIGSDAVVEETPEFVLTHDVTIFAFGATETDLPKAAAYSEQTTIFLESADAPLFACFFYMH